MTVAMLVTRLLLLLLGPVTPLLEVAELDAGGGSSGEKSSDAVGCAGSVDGDEGRGDSDASDIDGGGGGSDEANGDVAAGTAGEGEAGARGGGGDGNTDTPLGAWSSCTYSVARGSSAATAASLLALRVRACFWRCIAASAKRVSDESEWKTD
jgi:hypothetical protein